jgi:hypothetical protein
LGSSAQFGIVGAALYELVNADNIVLLRISPQFARAWLENRNQQTDVPASRSDGASENAVNQQVVAILVAHRRDLKFAQTFLLTNPCS